MVHPIANGYHADVGSPELLLSVFHHRFRFLGKHQHVYAFALGHQRVAAHFVVAHMGAKHPEGIIALFQFVIQFEVLGGKGKCLACIACKAVDHHLPEAIVVFIAPPKRLQCVPSKPFAIEPVASLEPLAKKHIERHHYRHAHIIDVEGEEAKAIYKLLLPPSVTVGSALPFHISPMRIAFRRCSPYFRYSRRIVPEWLCQPFLRV